MAGVVLEWGEPEQGSETGLETSLLAEQTGEAARGGLQEQHEQQEQQVRGQEQEQQEKPDVISR
jgi:hypothetical protein